MTNKIKLIYKDNNKPALPKRYAVVFWSKYEKIVQIFKYSKFEDAVNVIQPWKGGTFKDIRIYDILLGMVEIDIEKTITEYNKKFSLYYEESDEELEANERDEASRTCDNCDFIFDSSSYLEEYDKAKDWSREPTQVKLCRVCAHSRFSTAIQHPNQVEEPVLYKAIAWGVNEILQRIDKGDVNE